MSARIVAIVAAALLVGAFAGYSLSLPRVWELESENSALRVRVEQLEEAYGSLMKYFFVGDSWFSTSLDESGWWGVEVWNWNPDSVCEVRDGCLRLFCNETEGEWFGNSGVFQGRHADSRFTHQLLVGNSLESAFFGDYVIFPKDMQSGRFWLETRFRILEMGFNRYPTAEAPGRNARVNLGLTLMCAINDETFDLSAQTLWLDIYFAGYTLNETNTWSIFKDEKYVAYHDDVHAGYFVGEVSPEDVGQWVEMRVDLREYMSKTLDLIEAVDVESIRVYGFILFVECLGAHAETEYDYVTTHV